MFDNITVDEEIKVEEQEVKVAQSWIKESGAYDVEVKMFRFKQSAGGAYGFVIDMETEDGAKISYDEWFTNREGGSTYIGKQDGKKHDLPGMAKLKNISRALTGNALAFQKVEKKTVGIYDFNAKASVDTKVDVFTEALGNKVKILVQRVLVNKSEKSGDKWVPTAETREENTIVAWCDPETGKTFSELSTEKPAGTLAAFTTNIAKTPVQDKRTIKTAAATTEASPEANKAAEDAFGM